MFNELIISSSQSELFIELHIGLIIQLSLLSYSLELLSQYLQFTVFVICYYSFIKCF